MALFGSLPATVVTPHWDSKVTVQRIYPQSWAFFTRDPKSASVVVYLDAPTSDGNLQRADPLPQSLPSNGFGISRTQRAADTEKAIYSTDPNIKWTDCRGLNTAECFEASSEQEPVSLKQVKRGGELCGTLRIARTEPVHFPFRESSGEIYKINEMARVDVEC